MHGSRSAYTRARILDVAGRLFARKGHDNTSLREVTAEAQVNLSSVNYHFGSKEGLVQAVYERQLDILDRERLALLDRLEAEALGAAVVPASIVEAFFGPLIHHAILHAAGKTPFLSMLERPVGDPSKPVQARVSSCHAATIDRYRKALLKALPDVPELELLWRFQFMLGAASSAIMGIDALLIALKQQDTEPFDPDRLSKRLTAFLSGGLLAPLPHEREEAPPSASSAGPPGALPPAGRLSQPRI